MNLFRVRVLLEKVRVVVVMVGVRMCVSVIFLFFLSFWKICFVWYGCLVGKGFCGGWL